MNNQTQQNVTSLLIASNKQRLKNTIYHYHRNLPPTFMETKKVIKHVTELKDISENEIKNTMFIDPLRDKVVIPISSRSGVIKEDKMYIIPDFLPVSHRKKLMDKVFGAYTRYVSEHKKNRNLQGVHTKALELALLEINAYIIWVGKNNDRLVKNYPEMFKYRSKDETVDIPAPDAEIKEIGFIGKIKKMFVGGN